MRRLRQPLHYCRGSVGMWSRKGEGGVENINREHPELAKRRVMWRQYQDLYVGGERFRGNASEYLVRRQREPHEVYRERLSRVFYENYAGSIIDWYAAT